jgi:hypothetical protein
MAQKQSRSAARRSASSLPVKGDMLWWAPISSATPVLLLRGEVGGSEQKKDTMPIKSKYLFVASMDVDPDKEALFNEVYDAEHVPNLLKVPGVHAVTRMIGEPFVLSIGGEEKRVAQDGPRYSALYEIDNPHVLASHEWAKASEMGRWPNEVRPFTRNRRHALYRLR